MTMLEVLVGNLLLYLFMARCYGNSSKMSLVYIQYFGKFLPKN